MASRPRITLGLPLIRNEPGEVRDFLPQLVGAASHAGAEVNMEAGYGTRLGLTLEDYVLACPDLNVVERRGAFASDIVVMLRPSDDAFRLMSAGTTFVSMLHFPTHKARAKRSKELGIDAIALDLIVNDEGERLVENMKSVAWNGLDKAFGLLEKLQPDFLSFDRPVTRVAVIGAGLVGKQAVEAATKFGSLDRFDRLSQVAPGVEVTTLGRNLTSNEEYMRKQLYGTDVLVDAARRSEPSLPVIPNEWLGELPVHAVIVDLATDPYLLHDDPPVVHGLEGIPCGDLDRFVFSPTDEAWDLLPSEVPTTNRRWVVSCYSWPGVYPLPCMTRYGNQVAPLLETLIERGGARFLRADGDYFERALHRGSLASWIDRI